jgi:hypothetical protein
MLVRQAPEALLHVPQSFFGRELNTLHLRSGEALAPIIHGLALAAVDSGKIVDVHV